MNHDDYYEDDNNEDEILDAIEAEMDSEMNNNTAAPTSSAAAGSTAATSSSLPAHMVKNAAEFWFPECRDCGCCNGFKHGCACGGLCTCSGGRKVESNMARGGPSHYGGVPGGSGGGAGAGGAGRGGNYGGNSKAPCRFFQMGTCRFGDSCRFSHS